VDKARAGAGTLARSAAPRRSITIRMEFNCL
jgi:hypothetical protein